VLKKFHAATAAALLIGFMAFPASAEPVLFTFSDEFSESGGTCANVSCATLSVEQVGNDVNFILTANLASGEFITGLYGNLDPFAAITVGATGGTTDEDEATFSQGLDAFKADGDGDFDWMWDFSQSPPRLDGAETFTWSFLNVSIDDIIDAVSQDGPAGKTGFTFALRVQGLGADNQNSGWFYAVRENGTPPEQISEPGILALFAVALLTLGLVRRRRGPGA
jgi:hypothetical protein